ncbi:MAG TPA: universal stress protein [Mycobacteriales bacterium]|nr:universal stress protein [Mycobacteriales bacterium]
MAPSSPTVVVGVDGSRESVDALRWAIGYAGCAGGSVRAVTAWHRQMDPGYYGGMAGGYAGYPPIDPRLAADSATATLAAVVHDAAGEKPAVSIQQRVVEGHPAGVLIDEARSADLLVVGARGHSAITNLLIGSVSTHCIHHAACPVVVVRHGATTTGP